MLKRFRTFLLRRWEIFLALRTTSPWRFWFLVVSLVFSNTSLLAMWYFEFSVWYRLVPLYLFALGNTLFYFEVATVIKNFDRTRPFLVAFLVALAKDPKAFQLFCALKILFFAFCMGRASILVLVGFEGLSWLLLFSFSGLYRDLGQFPEFNETWSNVMSSGKLKTTAMTMGTIVVIKLLGDVASEHYRASEARKTFDHNQAAKRRTSEHWIQAQKDLADYQADCQQKVVAYEQDEIRKTNQLQEEGKRETLQLQKDVASKQFKVLRSLNPSK